MAIPGALVHPKRKSEHEQQSAKRETEVKQQAVPLQEGLAPSSLPAAVDDLNAEITEPVFHDFEDEENGDVKRNAEAEVKESKESKDSGESKVRLDLAQNILNQQRLLPGSAGPERNHSHLSLSPSLPSSASGSSSSALGVAVPVQRSGGPGARVEPPKRRYIYREISDSDSEDEDPNHPKRNYRDRLIRRRGH